MYMLHTYVAIDKVNNFIIVLAMQQINSVNTKCNLSKHDYKPMPNSQNLPKSAVLTLLGHDKYVVS